MGRERGGQGVQAWSVSQRPSPSTLLYEVLKMSPVSLDT